MQCYVLCCAKCCVSLCLRQVLVTSSAWSCTYQRTQVTPLRATRRRTATRTAGASTSVRCPSSWPRWWESWLCTCSSTGTGSWDRAWGPPITCTVQPLHESPAIAIATGAAHARILSRAPHHARQSTHSHVKPPQSVWKASAPCPPPRSPCTR